MPDDFEEIDDTEIATLPAGDDFTPIEEDEFIPIEESDSLLIKDPPMGQYLQYKWIMDGQANKERALIANRVMRGEIGYDEGQRQIQSSQEYWQAKAGPYEPLSLKEHPIKAALGMGVGLIPYMADSAINSSGYALGGGIAAASAAAMAGQVPPFTVLPEELITIPTAFASGVTVGFGYGVIKNVMDIEGGNLYWDLRNSGIEHTTALYSSQAGGLLIGLLEFAQFKTLSKPFKLGFARLVGTVTAKKGVTQAFTRYLENIGVNIAQEELQGITGLVSKTIAGMIDKKPDAIPTREEWLMELRDTAIQAGVGFAVLGAPGLAVDVTTGARYDAKAKKVEAGKMLESAIEEYKKRQGIPKTLGIIVPEGEKAAVIGEEEVKTPIVASAEEKKIVIKAETAMQERLMTVDKAQTELETGSEIERYLLDNKIKKYEDGFLKEELSLLNRKYITTDKTANTIDQSLDELHNRGYDFESEQDLIDYLAKWDIRKKALQKVIEEAKPKKVTKYETTIIKEKLANIERGMREGAIKTKQEIADVQSEVITMLEDLELEPKDKAKFLRTIKNIQTLADFEKAFPDIVKRITKLREAADRRSEISDLRDVLSKNTEKLPPEYKEVIDAIRDKIDLKGMTPQKQAKIDSLRNYISNAITEGEDINIPNELMSLLDKESIDKYTTDQIKDLNVLAQRLIHQGNLKNKLIAGQQQRQFDAVKKQMIDVITKGEGLTEDNPIIKILKEQNKSLKEKTTEFINNFISENMRPELMISIMDGFQPGIITDNIWNPLWEAQKAELVEADKNLKIIKDIHANLNFAEVFIRKYDVGRFKGITKDMLMAIYALSFNEAQMRHLEATGITMEDMRAITDFLSEEEKTAGRNMLRFYDEYQHPQLDEVYTRLEGVSMGKEDNYFPIDNLEDISYNKELERDILERNYLRRAGVSKGMTKERVMSKKAFTNISYFGTILRNLRKVEHYKAFGPAIRDVNKILTDKEMRKVIEEKYGEKFYKVLDKWLKDVAYGGDKQNLSSIDKLSQWLRTNYAVAVIGGNLVSVSKAPISYIQGAEMAGKANVLKATAKFLTDPLGWNTKIDKKSELMRFRIMRQERELGEIVSQRTLGAQIGRVTGFQAVKEASMLPWTIIDKATCDIVWLGAYDSMITENKTEQQAIDYADMVIRRTQPMSGVLNLPETFRGPEYQKFFTIFRNQPNQNFNLLLESVLKKKGGEISSAEFMSNIVWYLLAPSILLGVINRKRLPEDLGEFAKDILNSAIGGVIYIGNLTNILASGFVGATTPLDSLLEDFYGAVTAKDMTAKMDKVMNILSKVLGFPYIAIKRIVKGEPFGKPAKSEQTIETY